MKHKIKASVQQKGRSTRTQLVKGVNKNETGSNRNEIDKRIGRVIECEFDSLWGDE